MIFAHKENIQSSLLKFTARHDQSARVPKVMFSSRALHSRKVQLKVERARSDKAFEIGRNRAHGHEEDGA